MQLGQTMLVKAIADKDYEKAKFLIEDGVDIAKKTKVLSCSNAGLLTMLLVVAYMHTSIIHVRSHTGTLMHKYENTHAHTLAQEHAF